ncbi:hypothetical protein ACSBR1_018349 [Camellia fascicularis]
MPHIPHAAHLVSLSLILYVRKVSVGGAIAFVLSYAVYAFVVAANEILRRHARRLKLDVITLLLPIKGSVFSQGNQEDDSIYSTLLDIDTESVLHLLPFFWHFSRVLKTMGSESRKVAYMLGVSIGCALSVLAFWYTRSHHPPQKFLLPLVLDGFLMSIIWFYMIANKLVALLVGLGVILRVNPSILGLNLLAWGILMGDLLSNVALAINGGDGV